MLQRQHHSMNRRRRYAKEALHVGLSGSHTMERRVCLDERQVLTLEVGELGPSFYYALTCRHRDLTTLVSSSVYYDIASVYNGSSGCESGLVV